MDSILPHDTAGWRLCLAADLLRDTGATVAHQVDSSNAFVLSTAFARQFGHRAPNTDASTSDLRIINLLGAMLYHGVNTEAGVVMRMSSVPRTAANSLGAEFAQGHEPGSLRPSEAREFLAQLSDADCGRHVPRGSDLAGSDLRDLWQVLSGSTADPGARSAVRTAQQPRSGSS